MKDTNRITQHSLVDLLFHLNWKSDVARHTDVYHGSRVNLWRDYLPADLTSALIEKQMGETLKAKKTMGIIEESVIDNLFDIKSSQFDRQLSGDRLVTPRFGRFYPKGMLKGIRGVFQTNGQPFRCVGINGTGLTVDFNHPLAGKETDISVVVGEIGHKRSEWGGVSMDWMDLLTTGPGMQARWNNQATDYFSDDPFERSDEKSDSLFYQNERLVHHIDETARGVVESTYNRFLTDGMAVLDLMGSWESHLPDHIIFDRLIGLGLNEDELRSNPRLSDYMVHDLNLNPVLPFEDSAFDVVVNTVSVEYLVYPFAIFNEVLRILRPDGFFAVTFSNRWFPTKAIRIWSELHEFERMGLVLAYFLNAGGFKDLQTYSMRGLPRPFDDPYFPKLRHADPVYAVWGRKA